MGKKKAEKKEKRENKPLVVDGEVQPSLRITMHGADVLITALIADRTVVIGFGRFLTDYDPKEIQISVKARKVLLAGKYRDGLNGAEFFGHNTLAWGDPRFEILLAPDEISVHGEAAKDLIRQFAPLEVRG